LTQPHVIQPHPKAAGPLAAPHRRSGRTATVTTPIATTPPSPSPLRPLLSACLLCLVLLVAACSAQPEPETAGTAASAPAGEPADADAARAEDGDEGETDLQAAAEAALDPRQPRVGEEVFEQSRGQDIVTDEELRAALQPPDGRWLVDEEGRRYYVMTIPKLEGYYRYVEPGRIVVKPGMRFDVLREGEEDFDVKMYEPVYGASTAPPRTPPPPVEVVEPPSTDRYSFEAFDAGLPKEGQWRNGFDVADMNGDGHLDIVHGPARKGGSRPWIFLGDSAGNWQRWSDARFSEAGLDYGDAAVADFNGDGNPDVAFASHLRGVLVMVGDGQGGFERWSEGTGFANPQAHEGIAEFSSRAIEVADWNGDGRPDVVALGEGPRMAGMRGPGGSGEFDIGAQGLVVFLNLGDGTWERRDQGVGRGQVFGDDLDVVDLDGDGRAEVVTSAGSFGRNDLLVTVDEAGGWERQVLDGLPQNAYTWSVTTADFDGDGRRDLAVGYQQRSSGELLWHTGIDVLLARPDGAWEPRTAISVPDESGIWALAAGDLDADGHADLVGVTGGGEVLALLGSGDGSFQRESGAGKLDLDTCRGYHVELRDLDGQPGDEILIGFAGEAGSEALIPELPRQCPSQGRLAVWRLVR
jgi:hypothetical protein